MGFLDRIKQTARDFTGERPAGDDRATPTDDRSREPAQQARSAEDEDARAIERYRYLLRTAPPETVEQVHAEAFSKLTDSQRQQLLAELAAELPPEERPSKDDPQTMARAATRAEYLRPGTMERTLSGGRQGPGIGTMIGGSLLGTVAGYVIGSALVSSFLGPDPSAEAASSDPSGHDAPPEGGGIDAAGGDFGGGLGDFGF